MKITNRHDLPRVLWETAVADQYDSGRPEGCQHYMTTTQLVRPTQINRLYLEHEEELEMDVADLAWAMLGRGFHRTREVLADSSEVITEERLYGHLGKWTIGGKIDLYDPREHLLADYKATKVYAVQEGMKLEWFWQLQINAWLVRLAGFETQRLAIIAILKDWSAKKAQFEPSYPQIGFKVLYEKPMSNEQVEGELTNLLWRMEQNPIPPCSDEERWKSGGNVAVVKAGRKRAIKLFSNTQDATWWISEQKDADALHIQERPAEYQRCENYCPVARWCPQWQAEQ